MSRAQQIQGFFASQTFTPRITGNLMPELGTHGLRCEVRRYGELPRTVLIAFGHQP